MEDADHGGQVGLRMACGDVLNLDGADPFPPDLITSLERSVICVEPLKSRVATSPVEEAVLVEDITAIATEDTRPPQRGP